LLHGINSLLAANGPHGSGVIGEANAPYNAQLCRAKRESMSPWGDSWTEPSTSAYVA
jgi:hypothetical protein